jgi:hypothetical protein
MRYALRFAPLLLLVVIAASCAPTARPSDDAEPRSSSTRLIRADIMRTGEQHLYGVIDRLRPRWLRVRSVTSLRGAAPVMVYHDNVRSGTIEVLYNIRVEGVQEVRFVNATDATTRWGMGVSSGAIEVISGTDRTGN